MPLSSCSLGFLYFTTRSLHTLASDRSNRNMEIRLIRVLFKLPEDQGWDDLDGWPSESGLTGWDRVRRRNVWWTWTGSCVYGIGLEILRARNCYKYCINARFIKWRHLTARTAILVSHKRSSPSSNARLFARSQKARVHSETSVVVCVCCVEFRRFRTKRILAGVSNSFLRVSVKVGRLIQRRTKTLELFRVPSAVETKGSREEEESRIQSEIQRRIASLMPNGTREPNNSGEPEFLCCTSETSTSIESVKKSKPKRMLLGNDSRHFCLKEITILKASQRENQKKQKKKKKKGRKEKQSSNRGSERSITFNPCNDDNRSIS